MYFAIATQRRRRRRPIIDTLLFKVLRKHFYTKGRFAPSVSQSIPGMIRMKINLNRNPLKP